MLQYTLLEAKSIKSANLESYLHTTLKVIISSDQQACRERASYNFVCYL